MNDLREILVDPSEKFVSVLGNNYVQSFLNTGYIGNGFAVLTDRRVYFKGTCLYKQGKKYVKRNEERILDIENVTGSGFEEINPFGYLIAAIILTLYTLGSFINFFQSSKSEKGITLTIAFIAAMFCIGLYILYFTQKRTCSRLIMQAALLHSVWVLYQKKKPQASARRLGRQKTPQKQKRRQSLLPHRLLHRPLTQTSL